MQLKTFALTILALVACTFTFAQSNQYQFTPLDIRNGLSHNQVNCIHKDSKGFIWFGTLSGLNRYDGYTFKTFKHNNKDSSSLSDNFIMNIYEGPYNKLWIETRGGFNIYNPSTERFEHNVDQQLAALHIKNYYIKDIKKDRFGNFWFRHSTAGIYKFMPGSNKTLHFEQLNNKGGILNSNTVADMVETASGDFWIIYLNGIIEKLNHKTNKISSTMSFISKLRLQEKGYYSLFCDKQDDLWIFDPYNPYGLFYLNTSQNTFKHISKTQGPFRLNSDIITKITQDDKNIIWVGTDHGGVNLIDKRSFEVKYLVNKEDDDRSLCQNSTTTIYKDNTGIIWIGTYKKGISYYNEHIIMFPIVKRSLTEQNTLASNDINHFAEDDKGNLWIGTNGQGLVYYDREKGTFKNFTNEPSNTNSLSNNVVVSLKIDHKKRLWIGTYFGGLDCYDGKNFIHYKHDSKLPSTVCDDRISDIFEDSAQNLWIGTTGGGLDLLNPETKVFLHYNSSRFPPISSNYISRIIEDEHKNIWIGTSYGLNVLLNGSGKIIFYKQNDPGNNNLINDNTTGLLEDSRHLFWISTRDGLSIFNPQTQHFTNLTKDDGLPDNTVLDILEDNAHHMWISTSNGLCKITVSGPNSHLKFQFKDFDETDGLQGKEFNQHAAFKTKSGELIFGGANGFNIFDPALIKPVDNSSKLVFTDFLIFNKSVKPTEAIDGNVILDKSISETSSLTLHHNENVFTIEFAELNFFDPIKTKHQYMMEGFDKGWLFTDNITRRVTYTNLDPGNYTFKVRAVGSGKMSPSACLTLRIKVLPPFWKTPIAYAFYCLLFLSGLFYLRQRGIQKIKKEFAAEKEKLENKRILENERREIRRMHELDLMKIKFFTNVSHEFRTPLSLIMAPVDKMLKSSADNEQKQQINMIKTNARRLLNLVNQLLDFRKMEVQELNLQTQQSDIIAFIKEVSTSFTDIAEKKHIGFLFDSEVDELITDFDHDKIERVLFNLLSNAFKFTGRGGHVSVILSLLNESPNDTSKLLEIKVIDSGIGIPKHMHDKIFERFFQHDVPDSLLNQGSGIGLSITREFVKMHNGNIFVESGNDNGSCFTIHLPLPVYESIPPGLLPADQNLTLQKNEPKIHETNPDKNEIAHTTPKKLTVLIVEDNDDFRFYLKDNLRYIYHIVEASNGKEGWQKALASHPDIMVSDISMPEMNGIELCKKIKSDERTFHIPVILLTALTGEQEQVKGLQIGANDYMTKPFNFEILLSKIKNLLILQQAFKKTYTKQMHLQLEDIEVESADEKLLCNVVDHIQKNILNPNLSVEELSKQMNMSRVSLYKKLLTITGKSPVELIRHIRLQKAAQLLEKSQLNVTGVCYEVGFNNPNYFTKAFKEEFNMLPSDYITMVRKKDLHAK